MREDIIERIPMPALRVNEVDIDENDMEDSSTHVYPGKRRVRKAALCILRVVDDEPRRSRVESFGTASLHRFR